jgi:predicted RNase H-like nuclease
VIVVGVDGCPSGWVAVALDDGALADARFFPSFADVLTAFPRAEAVAVDMPIGLPAPPAYRRRADQDAAAFLRGQQSVVFPTYPREVYEAQPHATAVQLCRSYGWPAISRQSYGLWKRIAEVEACRDERVHEVHPEVSFRALANGQIGFSKRSWNGFFERRRLLRENGIELPDDLGGVPLIDTVDAGACSWSARRIAAGAFETLPRDPAPGEPTIFY